MEWKRRPRAPMTWRSPSQETPELDADYKPADLIQALTEIPYEHDDEFHSIRIDRGVRDYLVARLAPRRAG